MKSTAGKGSSPRNCFSDNYRRNYDEIFGKRPRKITLAMLMKYKRLLTRDTKGYGLVVE